MAVVQVRMSDEKRDAIEKAAREQGVSVSEWIREACERSMRLHKAKMALLIKAIPVKPDVVQDIVFDKPSVVHPSTTEPSERGVGWTDDSF